MVVMSVGIVCKLKKVLIEQWKSLPVIGSANNSSVRIFGQESVLLLPKRFVAVVIVILFVVFSVWGSTSSHGWVGVFIYVAVGRRLVGH